ncbi:MAG: asparagine synthase (glutamine-hydrolyzing) [Rhodocyclaceae bacterium]|nr:asparagine synthase (glutamine-hydrolyzing) [Rhodocyclaceae bacterium]
MCGIYGILDLTGAVVDASLLDRMGQVTRHRGPDDQGVHVDGPCAIGMRRLSIIDLAGGHQPLKNADATLWLVCNGEIYNFRELRAALERRGHRFLSGSDCEVIIHLYAEYGDTFVDHLNGMFNFALWDVRRRRLIIGRDRLGVKPLYVRNDGRMLAFATEAKALLTLPGVVAEVDPLALHSYLQLGYVAAPCSIFKGIAKLPPATLMFVENGRVEQRRYWRLPAEIEVASEAQWIERVRDRIEQSVHMQMVSDVPIGAFLSGGIDSSAVVAYMAKHSGQPIRTYAIGFSGGAADEFYNELPYARRVAQLFGTEHREIEVKPDVVGLLPKLLWHMDEPIADTAFITTYLVAEFARREVTVILSGVGGDELFGGYRRYLGNHYLSQFDRLPRPLKRAAISMGRWLPSDRHSGLLNLLRYARGFLASADLSFEDRYRSYVEVFGRNAASDILLQPPSANFDPLAAAFAVAGSSDSLNRLLAVDAETQLPDDLLLLTDKMTMATSLECRVPLLDHELVELAARMPESLKLRGGVLKYTLKKALADVLPDDILHRKKRGFGTPMGAWLKGELAPLLKSVLSEASIGRRGLFRFEAVRALIAAHERNAVDGTDQLLSLLNFEVWARIYLDGREAADVATELKESLT